MNHLAIRASAGTGKTYELANRFIAALLETGDPATILATTFTRKAAGEILGRIIRKLADATTDTPAALRLGSEVRHAVPDRAPNWGALLAVCCRSLHHLNVSTIDSLFVRLLSGFMLEAGLASVPALTDARSPDAERLRASALSQVLAHLPHPEALRILDDLNGGKSKRSVVPRLEQTILGLYEVARSAPHEAWGRFRVPDPPEADALGAAIGTIEAVAARESRPALSKGLLASVEYAASARWADVLTKGASSKVGPSTNAPHAMPDGERFTYSRCPIPVEALAPLRTLCDAASHHLALAVRARSNAMRDLVTGYSDAYDRLARGADMLLFSDLPRTIADAVRKGGPDDLTYRLGLSIRHVLLDEFQDTSPAQWHVLKEAIVGDPQAGAAGSRSNVAPASRRHSATVFCVGDTKQAIYGWRGGCAGIFDRLEAELPGIMWEHRERSYRSSQVILDTVNRVFGGLAQIGDLDPYQAATSRWAAEYHLHVAAHNLPGYAVLMEPCDDDGPEAESDSADAEDLDASDTVSLDRASAYIAWATALIRDTVDRNRGHSVGVLTRTNQAAVRLSLALQAAGVRAGLEGPGALADDPATGIILSAMLLADHPGSVAECFHVQNSPLGPFLGIRDSSYNERCAASLRVRRAVAQRGYADVVADWAEALSPFGDARTARRLTQLVEAAAQYGARATPRPADFVRWVREQTVTEPSGAAVRVMTIHQAKGLEFDIVVAPELHQRIHAVTPAVVGIRPTEAEPPTALYAYPDEAARKACPELREAYAQHRVRELSDALNLLYVAMTRPRHALYLLMPRQTLRADGSPRKANLSHASLLRAALQEPHLATPGVLFEQGDRLWSSREDMRRPGDAGESPPTTAAVGRIVFAHRERRRHWPETAPSELEERGARTARDLLRLDTAALRHGALLHAWFQLIGWLDEGRPDDSALTAAGRVVAPFEDDAWFMERAPIFYELLKRPAVADVFRRPPGEVELWRERPFVVRTGGAVVRGRLDRLVITRRDGAIERVLLTDFKTDDVSPDAVPSRAARYDAQMRTYVLAVSAMLMTPLQRIGAQLLFVGPGIAHEVQMVPAT